MAVSKSVIVLLALVAVAAAGETSRVKKQVFVSGPLPYVAAVNAVVPPAVPAGEDDGSWSVGKYDPLVVAAAPLTLPYVAAPIPYALPYVHPFADDGSYFSGKYGPENQ